MSRWARSIAVFALLSLSREPKMVYAEATRPPRTGGSYNVTVRSRAVQGLEIGMPRKSLYAQGIDLDRRRKWPDSFRSYQGAVHAFEQLLKQQPNRAKEIEGWIAKAQFEREQSRSLKYRSRYTYSNASSLYSYTSRLHEKWLSIRSFTGRKEQKLAEEILKNYRRVITMNQGSYYQRLAQIAVAAFLLELGQTHRGRRQFAKARQPFASSELLLAAYYYTVAGKSRLALDTLARAFQRTSSWRRQVRRSNRFDRLRAHPRFRKLIANTR